LPWYFSSLEKLVPELFYLPDLLLPLIMRGILSTGEDNYFGNDLFFYSKVILILIIKLVIILLSKIMYFFGSLTKPGPNIFPKLFCHRSKFFFPHFMQHLKFPESPACILFLCKFLCTVNDL